MILPGPPFGSHMGALPLVQVFFARPTPFNFAQVVSELRALLDGSSPEILEAHWDQDDLVTLDLGHLRVILCCGETEISGGAAHLTLGLTQTGTSATNAPRLEAIAQVLARRLESRHGPETVVWAEILGPLTPEAMELAAHDMFRVSLAGYFTGAEPLAELRKPVSESDVMAFFGRMPQVVSQLRGKAPEPTDHRRDMARPMAAQTLARRKLPTWVLSGALGVAALIVVVPLGLSLLANGDGETRGLARSVFKVIPLVSGPTSDRPDPVPAIRPDAKPGFGPGLDHPKGL